MRTQNILHTSLLTLITLVASGHARDALPAGLGAVHAPTDALAGDELWSDEWHAVDVAAFELDSDDEDVDAAKDTPQLAERALPSADCAKPHHDPSHNKHKYGHSTTKKHGHHKPKPKPTKKKHHAKPSSHGHKHTTKTKPHHHSHTKTSSSHIHKPTKGALGSKCSYNQDCGIHIPNGKAVCRNSVCDFRCLNGTIKSGKTCTTSTSEPLTDEPVISGTCVDGWLEPAGGTMPFVNPNNASCIWDPSQSANYSYALDPCFFDYVFGTSILGDMLQSCGFDTTGSKTNWIEVLAHYVNKANSGVTCTLPTIAGGSGCSFQFEAPSGDPQQYREQKFVAWAYLLAFNRYYNYQTSNIHVLQASFGDVLSTDYTSSGLGTLLNALTNDKPGFSVPPQPPAESKLSLGLDIASTLLSIAGAALPIVGLAEKTAEGVLKAIEVAHIVGESIGIGAAVFGNSDALADEVGTEKPLGSFDPTVVGNYIENARDSLVDEITGSITKVTNSIQAQVDTLASSGGAANWFTRNDIDLWLNPGKYVDSFTIFVRAWAVSRIFAAKSLFFHANTGCPDATGIAAYPQYLSMIEGQCVTVDDQNGQNPVPNTYNIYPVAYTADNDYLLNYFRAGQPHGPTNQFARNYFSASNLANFNITWAEVFASSLTCHYGYNGPLSTFDPSYPPINLNQISGPVFDPLNIDRTQIPCFWNMPIASSDLGTQCHDCRFNDDLERCCCGQVTFSYSPRIDAHGESANFWYTNDNLGLDDWAAEQVGRTPFGDAENLGRPLNQQCCNFDYYVTCPFSTLCRSPGCFNSCNDDTGYGPTQCDQNVGKNQP